MYHFVINNVYQFIYTIIVTMIILKIKGFNYDLYCSTTVCRTAVVYLDTQWLKIYHGADSQGVTQPKISFVDCNCKDVSDVTT